MCRKIQLINTTNPLSEGIGFALHLLKGIDKKRAINSIKLKKRDINVI
jgi:hypothetical protein